MVKLIYALFGLYAGVMSWLFKTAWNDIQVLKKELGDLRANQAGTLDSIRNLIDERFDKIEEIVERKVQTGLEAGFTKIELSWVNEGRISPKKTGRRHDEQVDHKKTDPIDA
jgi:hypothetical protein